MEGFQLNFIYLMAVFLSVGLYMQRRINNQIDSRVYSYFKSTLTILLSVIGSVLIERFVAYLTHSLILSPFIISIVSGSGVYWYYKLLNSSSSAS